MLELHVPWGQDRSRPGYGQRRKIAGQLPPQIDAQLLTMFLSNDDAQIIAKTSHANFLKDAPPVLRTQHFAAANHN